MAGEYLYRTPIDPDTTIEADKLYSHSYSVLAPELSEETLKLALDVVIAHFIENYPLKQFYIITWGRTPEGAIRGIEVSFEFSSAPNLTHREFSNEIIAFAKERYVDLEMYQTALFKARFPWWALLIALGIGGVAIGSAVKKGG